jgi:uncharacterized membrane-anchored protein
MTDTVTAEDETVSVEDVKEVIGEVQEEILEEDKMGATREMMVEGTCQRIASRVDSLPSEDNQ